MLNVIEQFSDISSVFIFCHRVGVNLVDTLNVWHFKYHHIWIYLHSLKHSYFALNTIDEVKAVQQHVARALFVFLFGIVAYILGDLFVYLIVVTNKLSFVSTIVLIWSIFIRCTLLRIHEEVPSSSSWTAYLLRCYHGQRLPSLET